MPENPEARKKSEALEGGPLQRIGLAEVIVAFALYFAAQTAAGLLVVALGYDVTSIRGGALLLILAVSVGAGLLAVAVAVAIRARSPGAVGLRRIAGRWVAFGVGIGVLVWFFNRLIVALYIWISGDSTNPQQGIADTATQGSFWQFAALVALGGLLAPFAEELLFRGVLYAWLRRWGVILAAAVSASVFGLFHGVSIVLPAAILLGVICSLAYEKSGSIWPPVAIHATNNTLIFVLARALVELGVPVG